MNSEYVTASDLEQFSSLYTRIVAPKWLVVIAII